MTSVDLIDQAMAIDQQFPQKPRSEKDFVFIGGFCPLLQIAESVEEELVGIH